MKQWVNFHAHSYGSLLDGASRPEQYFERAKELGMPAACFTDHGNIHILLDAYKKAKEVGLPFFPGEEFYQARKTRFDRDDDERSGRARSEWDQRGPYHLGVIAYNNEGYHNLIKLSSRAYTEGYFVKPRIDHDLLAEHAKGLVVLSGCLSGEIQQALLRDDFKFALDTAGQFQDIVGKENFFIELQNHGIEEELRNHQQLIEIANIIGAPIIPTCDCHYTHQGDAHYHDVMLCINTAARINDEGRFKFHGEEFYLKSYDEMASMFPEEYLKNTLLIAEKYDLDIKHEEYHFPQFKTPDNKTIDEYFKSLVYAGAMDRFGSDSDWTRDEKICGRLKYEIDVINQMGFPNYFLVVADIVNWAKDNGILVGPGRGSAAGSLVAYCLKITEVDPLKYDLPFERFLVPGRKTMPDIDLDFDDRYREKVIEYTRQKYGHDHTCRIATFSEMKAKKAVRDVARVLDLPYEVGDKISKAMPPALFGVPKTLDECLETAEFRSLYENDEDVKRVIDTAKQLEGLWRETGIHAAGLVVADKPITEYIPVMQKGENAPVVSQWDMHKVEECMLLKIDFLGSRNVSVISMCVEELKESGIRDIEDPYKLIDEEDAYTYEALGKGENVGVFQLESTGIRDLMLGIKPKDMHEISAILALYRPGPMGSNVHNEYVARKYKRKPISYVHPSLEPILKDTYGLLLYQEQLLKIATDVAGFTIREADDMRKAVGKKKMEEMVKLREKFIEGCVSHTKMPKHVADKLFAEIEHHASYSFGKNHSISYSFISYITSYLRTHYPTQYFAAVLSTVQDNVDRLQLYLNECKAIGIEVSPPSINYSDYEFKVKGVNEVVYGFSAIKGIGDAIASQMISTREHSYDNLFQFMRDVDSQILNKKILEHFAASGCFDDALDNMPMIPVGELSRGEKLQTLLSELEELGVFISDHPFHDLGDLIEGKITDRVGDLAEKQAGSYVKVPGIVTSCTKKITKAGKRMYKMRIEDINGGIMVDILPKFAEGLPDDPFQRGDILIVEGKVDKFMDDENATSSLMFFSHEKVGTEHLVGGRPVYVHTDKQLSFETLNKIHAIIQSNKGNSPVILEFNDGNTEVKMKFNDLTSVSIEDKIKFLIEVAE